MSETQRAVQYDEVGTPTVLRFAEVPVPEPGEGRALLRMKAVGLNPYDLKVLTGVIPSGANFPRGIGGDVAGEVTAVGPDAVYTDGSAIEPGHVVFGWGMNTLREKLIVRATSIALVPEGLSLAQAASLATPAFAAHAFVTALALPATGTVLVSAASGAVGFLLAQWAVRAGLQVIGTASERNFDRLRAVGITPVAYGDGLADGLREVLNGAPLAAVYDSTGESTLAAATEVGATAMVTIAGDEVAERFGAISTTTTVRDINVLVQIATEIAAGDVKYPVEAEFELKDVVAAFELLATGHSSGKIVVTHD